jgi:hypothetical protein
VLVVDMIEIIPPLGKYKYDTWRILPVKCYIDNSVCLRSCIRNINKHFSLAGWPCFMSVWPAASRTHVYTMSRRLRRWRKSVEAAPPGRPATWLGRPATTWCQTDLSELVELPRGPINTPYRGNERTHTTFFRFY